MNNLLSIFFCTVDPLEELWLTQTLSWKIADSKMGVFVIRSSSTLEGNYDLQLSKDNELLWHSTIRPFPKVGLRHPFNDLIDDSYYYLTSAVISSENIALLDGDYDVSLYQNKELLQAMRLEIEDNTGAFFAKEEEGSEETEQNIRESLTESVDDGIIFENDKMHDSLYEQGEFVQEIKDSPIKEILTDVMEESLDDQHIEVAVVEQAQEEEHIRGTKEFDEEIFISNETQIEDRYIDELKSLNWNSHTMKEMYSIFRPEQHFTVGVEELPPRNQSLINISYQIYIEKIENSYIAVIHEQDTRPFYLLINGEPVHQWDNSFASYCSWLEEQICRMYNIPLEEIQSWNSVLIVDEGDLEGDIPVTTCITRKQVKNVLEEKYPIIVDWQPGKAIVQICFQEDQKRVTAEIYSHKLQFLDGEPTKETVNDLVCMMEGLLNPFGKVKPLLAGYCSFPSIRGLVEEDNRGHSFFSLAWELTHYLN